MRAVVGIGASAGGLEALSLLLKHLPNNTGMAFVYIQHLDPTHDSMLTPILSRISPIPVEEATQGTYVAADTLYVIPPNKSMHIVGGVLQLAPRKRAPAAFLSIDTFFRSLAEDQKERSIGIILSGNASDGTLGLKAIKGEGGITFAQTEDSATYPSMPHSATTLGDVDHVLAPASIARELGRISHHPHIVVPRASVETENIFDTEKDKNAFGDVLSLLNSRVGVNFTQYKPMTLKRRIARRMVLNKIETLSGYVTYLEKNPKEIEELFHDALINVTEFFRDPEVFKYLKKKVFPQLTKDRKKDEHVRMWVAGSSTGEEVYSLAIAFTEFLEERGLNIPVQIFGTDLSNGCIERARRGVYPRSIESNVSKDRLQRFFTEVDGNYQVSKMIRDMCTFARQNIMSDPPFSKMDLVSCRNVLIYIEPAAQKRIIAMFHFALKSSGFLLLGKSEGVGQLPDHFAVNDKKLKIFVKKPFSRLPHFDRYVISKNVPIVAPTKDAPDTEVGIKMLAMTEIDQALLSSSEAPASVVVDADMEILQFRGDLSSFLQHPNGKATLNLMKIAKGDLQIELRRVIADAKKKDHAVTARDVRMIQGRTRFVTDIEVIPLRGLGRDREHLLVIFHQQKAVERKREGNQTEEKHGERRDTELDEAELSLENKRLHKQLEMAKEQLRTLLEEQESINEGFQSANEEVRSSNEELQSINEEIETTKEELQSTNEELITVNEELQMRNVELNVTNGDLTNVLSSSKVPIIIVDNQLRIRRVTPITKRSIRITTSDIGRSISDIKLPIKFPDLKKAITAVIDTMQPQSKDVVDESGDWYTLWIRPYRTIDNRIDGAIITLIDINEIKLAQMSQEQSLMFVQGILRTMREPVVVLDKKFRVRSANAAFYATFKFSPEKIERTSFYDLGSKEWDKPQVHKILGKVLASKNSLNFEFECNFPRISGVTMCVNARRLIDKKNPNEDSVLLVMEDITARKFMQEKNDTFMSMASHELRTPATTIKLLAEILQRHFMKSKDKMLVEYLGKIVTEVDHLAQISADLLDVSGIRAGKFVLHEEDFVLCTLVREIIENCQMLTKTHKILFRGERKTIVRGDRERIGRVFINLISNAIKYSPDADKIIVQLTHTKNSVTISVRDFGIGIAKKDQGKIFDHSFQIAQEKAQHSSGLGLGLYISGTIIQGHGGRIVVDSCEGEGSTFSFTLPVVRRERKISASAHKPKR